jgi:cytochrome c-type biogenesis protein CcmH/NrfG
VTYLLIGVLLAVAALAIVTVQLQRRVYEQLIATVEAERDKAVTDAKVYQRLLFPVLNRVEAGLGDANETQQKRFSGEGQIGSASASSNPAPQNHALGRRNVPFRKLFNEIRRAGNSSQQKTDALASALAKQKVPTLTQEKSHVAS